MLTPQQGGRKERSGAENGKAGGHVLTVQASASTDLAEYLAREVYPKLDAKTIYSDPAHNWQHESSQKLKGSCPWHKSKTGTSFYVSLDNLLWRCPVCGGGGPIQYRWRLRGGAGSPKGEDFVSVVRELCELAGVPFPEHQLSPEAKQRAERRETRRAILEVVENHCHEQLLSRQDEAARAYLMSRGLDQAAVRELRLGLYPRCSELRRVLRDKGFDEAAVRDSGVLFFRMEGYITFPWRDDRGAPLTMYGTWPGREPPTGKPKKMALPNPKADGASFEATKRSPLYLDRALKALCADVVLVEGVTDAAVAQSKGDARVVACVAAELSREQVATLRRRGVRSVTIALDPDEAGETGIESCCRHLRAAGVAAFVAPALPDGLDPDDFILRRGLESWKEHIRKAEHPFRWQAKRLLQQHELPPQSDAGREDVVREARAFAGKQPAEARSELQRYFWPEIADALRCDPLALSADVPPQDGADWPDPLPIPDDLPPVMTFDAPALLPRSFVGFVNDVAERMQCPIDFPAVALVIVLAAVVGAKLGIRPKRHDDWHVVPNLWGGAVGRPGVMKSPAIRGPLKFLQRLEMEAAKRHEEAVKEYATELEVYEAKKKARKEAILKAAKNGEDPQEAAKDLDSGEEPEEPTPKRYLVNDSTVEMLGVLLNQSPNGLLQFRDELIGLFKTLDKEGNEGMRAFYLEAWDGGGSFVYDRIMRGTLRIPNTTVSLLGGITPGALLDYLRAALQGGGGDDGLIQRLQLLVYPDVSRNWRNIDRYPETQARQRVWGVLERLDQIDPGAVPGVFFDHDHDQRYLRFDDAAQQLFDQWRAALEPRVRSGEEHPALESHLAKYRSLVPSLALLLHLADHDGGPVGATALRKALAWAEYLESHARRIYSLGTDGGSIAAKALAQRILDGDLADGFRARDVYRKGWTGLTDPQAVNQALDRLQELHWLKEEEQQQEAGGRKTFCYRLNPKLSAKKAPTPTDRTDKTGFVSSVSSPPARFLPEPDLSHPEDYDPGTQTADIDGDQTIVGDMWRPEEEGA